MDTQNSSDPVAVKLVVLVYIAAPKTDLFETFLAELSVYTKDNEAGCLEYRSKRLPESDGTVTYILFETYVNMAAYEEHTKSSKFLGGFEFFTKERALTKPPETMFLPEQDCAGSFSR